MSTFLILKEYFVTKYFRRFKDKVRLRHYQQEQVIKHLQYVLKGSPFYKELYSKNGNVDVTKWQQFPIIEKQMMMDHFDTLNTVGLEKDKALQVAFQAETERQFTPTINGITVGLSSGTSGNRGLFIVSEEERFRWAGVILAKLLPKSILHKERIAFFLRANSNLYTSTRSKAIQFKFFDLLDDLEMHVDRLNTYEPSIIVAPPSMLVYLAKQIQLEKLIIAPKKVISVAEVLDPKDKQYLENVFGQTIHEVYQCTEGFLATTCEYGTLHMNEDLVVIQPEFIDEEKKRFIPIITDFSRKSQPVIRYRLNDILHLKDDQCACGSPFMAIEQIEGRADDIFYFKELQTGKMKPIFPDFIRRAVIKASDGIQEYRVIQHSPTKLVIQLKATDELEARKLISKSFQELTEKIHVEVPKIEFESYTFKPGSVKLRRIERRPFHIDEDQRL